MFEPPFDPVNCPPYVMDYEEAIEWLEECLVDLCQCNTAFENSCEPCAALIGVMGMRDEVVKMQEALKFLEDNPNV